MPPEARVYFPDDQTAAFKKALEPVSGIRIIEITPDEVISIENLSAVKFIGLIKELEPTFVTSKRSFPSAFDYLRSLSPERQKEILVEILTKRVKGLPNAEAFSSFLADTNNIRWLQPIAVDESSLQEVVDESQKRLGYSSTKLHIVHKEALPELLSDRPLFTDDIVSLAELYNDEEAFYPHSIRYMLEGAIDRPIAEASKNMPKSNFFRYHAGSAIIRTAWWIVNKDFIAGRNGVENPYEPLIEIYKTGRWPVGLTAEGYAIYEPQNVQRALL